MAPRWHRRRRRRGGDGAAARKAMVGMWCVCVWEPGPEGPSRPVWAWGSGRGCEGRGRGGEVGIDARRVTRGRPRRYVMSWTAACRSLPWQRHGTSTCSGEDGRQGTRLVARRPARGQHGASGQRRGTSRVLLPLRRGPYPSRPRHGRHAPSTALGGSGRGSRQSARSPAQGLPGRRRRGGSRCPGATWPRGKAETRAGLGGRGGGVTARAACGRRGGEAAGRQGMGKGKRRGKRRGREKGPRTREASMGMRHREHRNREHRERREHREHRDLAGGPAHRKPHLGASLVLGQQRRPRAHGVLAGGRDKHERVRVRVLCECWARWARAGLTTGRRCLGWRGS